MPEIARLAIQSGLWPLWEYERGKLTINEVKRRPVEDYLKLQGRYSHLSSQDIEEIKQYIKDLEERIKRYATAYSA
jgi:pyruvate ferredoxin oxidoreductase beta subunit